MQTKTEQKMPLLNEHGELTRPSYSTFDVFDYNKDKIKNKIGLKEWEFYQISNKKWCAQLTFGHTSYIGNVAFSLIDFESNSRFDVSFMKLPTAKFDLSKNLNAEQKIEWWDKNFAMSMEITDAFRHIQCHSTGEKKCDLDLVMSNAGDAMCIATPMKGKKFYYNYKKNFQTLSGSIVVDGKVYELDENTFALVDSGRGVWEYKHSWHWGSATTKIDGHVVGFNIGWGFGDTNAATENMLFIDGVANKLDIVRAVYDKNDYTAEWLFNSSDGRFEMSFKPFYDNFTETNLLLIHNRCHQVFGLYTGKAVLDDGRIVNFVDVNGFCEHAINRW